MKRYALLTGITLSALLGAATVARAQQPCPKVRVSCPEAVKPGDSLNFTAGISGGDRNVDPTYNWVVSAGSITAGQGTSSIQVDTSGLGNQTVTATVDVGGFERSCSTSDSCTTSVIEKVRPKKLDEYPSPATAAQNERLDKFAIELLQEPDAQAYIIAYGGRRGRAGEAQSAADNAKSYLVTKRGFDASRIVTVDGGYRENLSVELWIVPGGATPPVASPTVDPSEVKLTAPAAKKRSTRTRKQTRKP